MTFLSFCLMDQNCSEVARRGSRGAKVKLEELASASENEFHIMYIPTREIIARVNVGGEHELTNS